MKLESAAGNAVQKKQPKRAKSVLIFNAVLNAMPFGRMLLSIRSYGRGL
jgi:hypothetical protein